MTIKNIGTGRNNWGHKMLQNKSYLKRQLEFRLSLMIFSSFLNIDYNVESGVKHHNSNSHSIDYISFGTCCYCYGQATPVIKIRTFHMFYVIQRLRKLVRLVSNF